jgi:hypothetical protein
MGLCTGSLHEELLCTKIKKLVLDYCILREQDDGNRSLLIVDSIAAQQQASLTQSQTPNTIVKRKELFASIHHGKGEAKKPKLDDPSASIKDEMTRYCDQESNDSMLLVKTSSSSTFNALHRLAIKYLCIPATSSAVERVFSQSGFLFRPHRCRMARKTLQQLTLLKCNQDLVQ